MRYDGGHQKDAYLTGMLARHFTWVPVCPEMEVGMGVPREPIRLVGDPAAPRLLGRDERRRPHARMSEFARRRAQELARRGLSGYVLKRASPSCGMERVKVYRDERAAPERTGVGLFARALMDARPLLPVEEEGRLNDPRLRENFITRVFAYRRLTALREMDAAARRRGRVPHRAQVPAARAQPAGLRAARPAGGRGEGASRSADWLERYAEAFMRALRSPATPRKNVNVLQHIVGFFKTRLGPAEKRELQGLIEDYARGLVPLVVPITLINHHVARLDVALRARPDLSPPASQGADATQPRVS